MYDQRFIRSLLRNYRGFHGVMRLVMRGRPMNRVDWRARQANRRRLVEAMVRGGSVRMVADRKSVV